MSARTEADRLERVARRLARRGLCTSHVPVDFGRVFCAQKATHGQMCSQHFEDAFNLGMVLH